MIPRIPEIFLMAWSENGEQNESDLRQTLRSLLESRRGFSRKKWEELHSLWERLMRILRPPNEYSRVPFCNLYNFSSKELKGKSKTMLLKVDGKTLLDSLPYVRGDHISLVPNVIIHPQSEIQEGWDSLIVYEVFPQENLRTTNKRYLLPVFVENEFSAEGATTSLSVADVQRAVNHCREFLRSYVTAASPYNFLPSKYRWKSSFSWFLGEENFPLEQFLVVFAARMHHSATMFEEAPENALFIGPENFQKVYGPVMTAFVNTLVPDRDVYIAPL